MISSKSRELETVRIPNKLRNISFQFEIAHAPLALALAKLKLLLGNFDVNVSMICRNNSSLQNMKDAVEHGADFSCISYSSFELSLKKL